MLETIVDAAGPALLYGFGAAKRIVSACEKQVKMGRAGWMGRAVKHGVLET
ncbi:hypothetical protein [Thermostilla marina]